MSCRWVCLVVALMPGSALACSLCANIRQRPTLRQEATQVTARLVLHGYLANAKYRADLAGAGTTDFHVLNVIKADPALSPAQLRTRGDVLVLGSYVPIEDAKNPPHCLLFCDVVGGKLDVYRPVQLTSGRTAKYLQAALKIDPRDVRAALHFFFGHLDHPDEEIATDAFMEFARASDSDIGEVAKELSPVALRRWLRSAATPRERLGLYAFLLGRCGNADDAAWFQKVLDNPSESQTGGYDGILGGFIQLQPRAGWELAEKVLREGKQPLPVRLAVVRMLRFYQAWQPTQTRSVVLKAMTGLVVQGELIDLAAEDLRRWKMWELTEQLLSLYGRKGLDAPIHKRALLRYALSCPTREAKVFLDGVRQREAELVREVEEQLR